MTKNKYDKARIILDRINHIKQLLKALKEVTIDQHKNAQSRFTLYKHSRFETALTIGEIEVMINAFETELVRLHAEVNRL